MTIKSWQGLEKVNVDLIKNSIQNTILNAAVMFSRKLRYAMKFKKT
jgi:hypothetical protein